MTEPEENEATEPEVTDVPEPDQEPHEPFPDEEEEEAEHEESESEPDERAIARSEKDIERAYEKLQRENLRHTNRVGEIMGDDAIDLVPCPLCAHFAQGHIFPVVPPPEIVGRVRAVIGLPEQENYEVSPFHEPCSVCRAMGVLRTGSLVMGQETVPCEQCHARGFVRKDNAPVTGVAPVVNNGMSTATTQGMYEQDMSGLDPAEVGRRMAQAIAQAQGHAAPPTP